MIAKVLAIVIYIYIYSLHTQCVLLQPNNLAELIVNEMCTSHTCHALCGSGSFV